MKKGILFLGFMFSFSMVILCQNDNEASDAPEIMTLKYKGYDCSFINRVKPSIDNGIMGYAYLYNQIPLIHWLCLCDSADLTYKVLSEEDVDVNIVNKYGSTPIKYALLQGDTKIVKYLLSKNATLGLINKYGEDDMQFFMEGQSDDVELFKLICPDTSLSKLDTDRILKLITYSIDNYKTAVYNHLWADDKANRKWKPEVIGDFMLSAISSGNLFVTKYLFDNYTLNQIQCSEPVIDKVCDKATYYNLWHRLNRRYYGKTDSPHDDSIDIKLLELITTKYALNLDEQLIKGEDILFDFIENYPAIEFLLSKKKNINKLNKEGKTFLQCFIDRIIRPDLINFNGKMYSTQSTDRDYSEDFIILRQLVNHGASANQSYKNGWSYLIVESLKSDKRLIVERLLATEPTVFIKDSNGKSAIDYVIDNGDISINSILRDLIDKNSNKSKN